MLILQLIYSDMYFFTFCSHSIIQDSLPIFFSFLITITVHINMYRNHLKSNKYCISRIVTGDSINTSQNKHNIYIYMNSVPKRAACIPIIGDKSSSSNSIYSSTYTYISCTGSHAHSSWDNIQNSLAHNSWSNHVNNNE